MRWWWNKANLMELDSCDRPSNLSQIGFKSSINHCMWPWNLMNDLKKTIRHLVDTTSSFVHHFKSIGEFKLESQSGNAQFGSKFAFFLSRVILKFDGWPWNTMWHLFYTTLSLCCISKPLVYSNWSYSPETLNLGQNWRFLSCVTRKFNGLPWKITGHLSYAVSSFVHHFIAIGAFKLELQSGNAQYGSKSVIFF